ncbi:MAG: type VI secretion system baseplate subunit TssE [Thiolinea sp.]
MAEVYLPSLLDRLADDSYVNSSLDLGQQAVLKLEKQLAAIGPETPPESKQQLIGELRQERSNLIFLQNALGSLQSIRDCVKRDLAWLLNSRNLCMDEELSAYPEIASSVLNYGLPDLTGKTASSLQLNKLEGMLEKAIITFEPRILPDSLEVKLLSKEDMHDHNALIFEISGWLWAEPSPLRLQLTTHLDLESGDMRIVE